MSKRFDEAALRLLPLAARLLNWPPDIFWRATPADLGHALITPSDASAGIDRAALNHLLEQEHDQ